MPSYSPRLRTGLRISGTMQVRILSGAQRGSARLNEIFKETGEFFKRRNEDDPFAGVLIFAIPFLIIALAALAIASSASGACSPGEPCWQSWQATQAAGTPTSTPAYSLEPEDVTPIVTGVPPCYSPYVFCPGETRTPPDSDWSWDVGQPYIYLWDDSGINVVWANAVPNIDPAIGLRWKCEFDLTGFQFPVFVATDYPSGKHIFMQLVHETRGGDFVASNGFCTISDRDSETVLLTVPMLGMPYKKGDHTPSTLYIPGVIK